MNTTNRNSNEALADRDLGCVWHPCTQMKDHEDMPLIPIRRGNGIWLEDFDGNQYLDAISSWWVNLFGHANPRINASIVDQLESLEHVMLAGFSHEPVIRLAEKLVEISPAGLARCFFADNGSSAVEIALKMSFHFWRNSGQPEKTKFVTLSNSYHGETLGALSVGNVELYKKTYKPLLLETLTVESPDCFNREPGENWESCSVRKLDSLRETLEKHHAEVCAVILEPLVQCAGGMRMYHPAYLAGARKLCDEFDAHLIADEIAVGFGRTGSMFACEQADVSPDFMCLSKGLTGGYLPLSVVLTSDRIYDAFYDDYSKLTAFLHSHSYTGNPLACSAALATIEIFESDNVLANNVVLARTMRESTAHLADHPHVAEVRQAGMILAIELVQEKKNRISYPWQQRRGLKVYKHALQKGALLRPLGNVIYFMPPYIITPEQINLLADIAAAGIDIATSEN